MRFFNILFCCCCWYSCYATSTSCDNCTYLLFDVYLCFVTSRIAKHPIFTPTPPYGTNFCLSCSAWMGECHGMPKGDGEKSWHKLSSSSPERGMMYQTLGIYVGKTPWKKPQHQVSKNMVMEMCNGWN